MTKILVIIPVKPSLHPHLRQIAAHRASALANDNPDLEIAVHMDFRRIKPQLGDATPWSRVTRARNAILDQIDPANWDHFLWVDADVLRYPADLPARLLRANPSGVTAPFPLIDRSEDFYDTAAFILQGSDHVEPASRRAIAGRNLSVKKPWFPQEMPMAPVEMDCVGCVTMVSTDIYASGARYEDHPSFTDHYPICKRAREMGHKVVADLGTIVYHANLPEFGESR